ncbi:endochitinase A-like [Helianthus annuus]|uniref:endochitinase A-like n=1 Tax=Helianthus annuus TaxID=4232 RepID=UPI000B8F9A42|nr:endochitinase A-like [Helianthus annuus]
MTSMETSMTEIKEMMKQMLEHSQSQPNTQQIANELWNSVQPILQAQRNLAEINHNTHMELIRNMVDARYKAGKQKGIDETLNKKAEEIALEKQKQQDTKESKASSLIKKEQDEQKKKENIGTSQRRKSSRSVRKPRAIPSKTSTEPAKTVSSTKYKTTTEPKTSEPKAKPSPQKPLPQQPPLKKQKKASPPPSPIHPTDASTTNVSADVSQTTADSPVVSAAFSQTSAIVIFSTPPITQPPPSSIHPTDTGITNVSADIRQTTVDTPVVSAHVSQTSAMVILSTPQISQPPPTPHRFPTHPSSSPKLTSSPKVRGTCKRKVFVVQEDDEEIKSPIPLSSVPTQTTPLSPFPSKSTAPLLAATLSSIIPLATQYPLEVQTVKCETESFFII